MFEKWLNLINYKLIDATTARVLKRHVYIEWGDGKLSYFDLGLRIINSIDFFD